MDAAVLEREASTLRAEVAACNRAIREKRKQRQDAQRNLDSLMCLCRRMGIAIVIEPQRSEGAVHGSESSP